MGSMPNDLFVSFTGRGWENERKFGRTTLSGREFPYVEDHIMLNALEKRLKEESHLTGIVDGIVILYWCRMESREYVP